MEYINVSNQHIAQLKLTQFKITLHVNDISLKKMCPQIIIPTFSPSGTIVHILSHGQI